MKIAQQENIPIIGINLIYQRELHTGENNIIQVHYLFILFSLFRRQYFI